MTKKLSLLFALMLSTLMASAHNIEVKNADGVTIYYNYIYNGTELEVTFRGDSYSSYSNEYQGNVVIPEEVTYMNRTRKVTSIGSWAFYNCSGLTSVTIGSGVKYIDNLAFASCSELADVYCYAENVPSTSSDAFKDSYVDYATLYVPEASVAAYKAKEPWSGFGAIKTLSGEIPVTLKCATPTISYENGKLKFSCATEGATCQYSITDTDIKAGSGNEVQLTTTYKVTVYATKDGYENSDEATLEINVSGGASGLRGDVNEDGEVNVGDMVVISNIMSGNE